MEPYNFRGEIRVSIHILFHEEKVGNIVLCPFFSRRDGADAGRINHGAFEGGFSFQPGKRKAFSVSFDEGFCGFSSAAGHFPSAQGENIVFQTFLTVSARIKILFRTHVSTASVRSFRRVGQRVGQGENSPLKNCAAVIKE